MSTYPTDRHYSEDHEWVLPADGVVRIGITDYAAEQLGDVVYVELPEVGRELAQGEACGELESTKSVSDVFSPVTGVVKAVNEAVTNDAGLVNREPYEGGWLFEVEVADPHNSEGLLDADGYAQHTGV